MSKNNRRANFGNSLINKHKNKFYKIKKRLKH